MAKSGKCLESLGLSIMRKVKCRECGLVLTEDGVLKSENPFDTSEIWGCPECRSIDSFDIVCFEPGCTRIAKGGSPNTDGYKYLCTFHMGS